MADVPSSPDEHRTFSNLVAGLEDGTLNHDTTEQLRDLVARLHDTERDVGGKPGGKIVLSINFRLDGGVIEIVSDVKVTMPKVKRGRTIMWATPNNNLTPHNPKQMVMAFRDVNSSGDVRAV